MIPATKAVIAQMVFGLKDWFTTPPMAWSQSFSKLVLTYRQHKSIINEQLTFSFRISSQQKLTGQIPFYMLPTIFDSRLKQDGIGGASSLRGAFRNRLAADGFVISSFETKLKFWQFNLFKQDFFSVLPCFTTMPILHKSINLTYRKFRIKTCQFILIKANNVCTTAGARACILFSIRIISSPWTTDLWPTSKMVVVVCISGRACFSDIFGLVVRKSSIRGSIWIIKNQFSIG